MFKQFKFIFLLTLLFVSISFVSSETWKYNYLPETLKASIINGSNYSINVNNTEFFRGLTPQQVADLIYVTANGEPKYLRTAVFDATCNTASATAKKQITIPDYTLTKGDLLAINFTLGTGVSSATLSVNGGADIPIRLGSTAVSTVTFNLGVGGIALLYYDGNYFQTMGSYRTSDSTGSNHMSWSGSNIQVGTTIYDYKIMMASTDNKYYPLTLEEGTGTTKTVSDVEFVINSPILWYSSTTNLNPDSLTSSVYSQYPITTFSRTANSASGFTAYAPIYLKGIINTNGNFVLDNSTYTSWLTQSLPTTEDGFIYIYLGHMYSTTTSMRLTEWHPIYEFKDGRLREYSIETDPLSHHKGENINLTDNKNISLGLDSFIKWGPLNFIRLYDLSTLIQGYDVKLVASNGFDYTGLVLTNNRIEKDEFTNFLSLGSPFNPFDDLFVKRINTTNITSENAYIKNLTTDNFKVQGEAITVEDVTGNISLNYSGSDFIAYGWCYEFDFYAYKNISGNLIYSENPLNLAICDDFDEVPYSLTINLSSVQGADGYLGLIRQDDWNSFWNDSYFYINQTNINYYSGVSLHVFETLPVVSQKEYIPQIALIEGNLEVVSISGDGSGLTNLPASTKRDFNICGERNGAMWIGDTYAMGNGGNSTYAVLPASGYIESITFYNRFSGTTGGKVQPTINGSAVGSSWQVSSTGTNDGFSINKFSSPLSFSRGARLGAQVTNTASATNGTTVCLWGYYEY